MVATRQQLFFCGVLGVCESSIGGLRMSHRPERIYSKGKANCNSQFHILIQAPPFRVYRVNTNANLHLVLLVLLGRPSHEPVGSLIKRPAEA